MTTRRGFIAGALAFVAAPAIVPATNIMPVRFPLALRPLLLPCDGRMLRRRDYSELFSVIGNQYGGDNANFRLPDLRGQFVSCAPPQIAGHQIKPVATLSHMMWTGVSADLYHAGTITPLVKSLDMELVDTVWPSGR